MEIHGMGIDRDFQGVEHWLKISAPISGKCSPGRPQAFCISFYETALPLCGGMVLPFAMGAVVEGVSWDCQTPLSGQFSPFFAMVPTSAI